MAKSDDLIKKLKEATVKPEKTVLIKRLDLPVKIRALQASEIEKLRESCNYQNPDTGYTYFDNRKFILSLIVRGTVEPNWADKELIEALGVHTAEEAVDKSLLGGEVESLGAEILKLSGYGGVSVEEIKN